MFFFFTFFFFFFFPSISVIYILLVTLSHSVLLILIIHEASFPILMHPHLPLYLYVRTRTGLDSYRTRSSIGGSRERSDCYFELLFSSSQEKNKTRCLSWVNLFPLDDCLEFSACIASDESDTYRSFLHSSNVNKQVWSMKRSSIFPARFPTGFIRGDVVARCDRVNQFAGELIHVVVVSEAIFEAKLLMVLREIDTEANTVAETRCSSHEDTVVGLIGDATVLNRYTAERQCERSATEMFH